ncbi:MAG: YidC/Oxa1 family insertase periplasmic-domain containing protein [Puniceicoccales bacterium]|nr:YidC/Oxa1 family insertase periplasmic-domain containing protein [Puniceicoccales bacterium]
MSSHKNTIIGVALLVVALGLVALNNHSQRPAQSEIRSAGSDAVAQGSLPAVPFARTEPAAGAQPVAPAPVAGPSSAAPSALPAGTAHAPSRPEDKTITLGNDSIRLAISTRTGGLRSVALLTHADTLEHQREPEKYPYFFNSTFAPVPALSLRQDTGSATPELLEPEFSVVEAPAPDAPPASAPVARRVVLASSPSFSPGLSIIRTYEIPVPDAGKKSDPNLVRVTTTFANTGTTPLAARYIRLNTGTLPPTGGDTYNQFLSVSAYDGDEFQKRMPADFAASGGFLGMGGHGARDYERISPAGTAPWKWVAVTNQYFAGIYRFAAPEPGAAFFPATDLHITPIRGRDPLTGEENIRTATGDVGFSLPALSPGQKVVLAGDYYVGPREYTRLAKLGQGEEKAVQFSKYLFISMDFLCKVFTVVLDLLHSIFPASFPYSWGLAIVLLTLIVKALTWPLVTAQQRSAEKMRRFQGPMKAIREKYKDDTRRQQQEMMKLYQEHKINPFAGCLPVLIQMPIFIGLFFTFQSLAQLRFQPFLWITDLSMPDLVPGLENFSILGVHLHLLPVFMGATMLLNLRLSPMPNMEGQQKVLMYGIMLFIPVFCYTMPAALMLYYSVQNILTIGQTFHTRRRMKREEAAEPASKVVLDLPGPANSKKGRKHGRG